METEENDILPQNQYLNFYQKLGLNSEDINIEEELQKLMEQQEGLLDLKQIMDKLFKNQYELSLENCQKIKEHWITSQKKDPEDDFVRRYFNDFFFENILIELRENLQKNLEKKEGDPLNLVESLEKFIQEITPYKQFLDVLDKNLINPIEEYQFMKPFLEKTTQVLDQNLGIDVNIQTFLINQLQQFIKYANKQNPDLVHLLPTQITKQLEEVQGEFNPDILVRFYNIIKELDYLKQSTEIVRIVLKQDIKNFVQQQQDQIKINNPFQQNIIAYIDNIHHNLLNLIENILITIYTEQQPDQQENQQQNNPNQSTISAQQKLQIQNSIKDLKHKLQIIMQHEYVEFAIQNIFTILLYYPQSHHLVTELSQLLEELNQEDQEYFLEQMQEQLEQQVKKRLLIPGVITQAVLNYYINCLKVLQTLDPRGVLFETITTPIKQYILNRNDVIRSIISLLTESDEEGEGYNQLIKQRVQIPAISKSQYDFSSDEDEEAAEKWDIQSLVNKKKELIKIKYQESDLLSILVNLYGSQEEFIKEYQNILSEKMMGTKETNIQEEFKNLELLKIRCGEQNLQACDIILKDVRDSKKINQNIHQNFNQPLTEPYQEYLQNQDKNLLDFKNLNCVFVSKGYWQIDYDQEEYQLPQEIQPVFQEYAQRFEKTKQQRKLQFHSNLGYVNISLEFDNGEFDFKCPPIQAILISYFDESKYDLSNGLTAQWISDKTNIPVNMIRQKMTFWIHYGVIKEKKPLQLKKQQSSYNNYEDQDAFNSTYFPVDVYEKYNHESSLITFEEEENELILRDQTNVGYESHQFNKLVESKIMDILQRYGPKKLEKIFNLLRSIYRADLGILVQKSTVSEILKGLVAQQKVYFNGDYFGIIQY